MNSDNFFVIFLIIFTLVMSYSTLASLSLFFIFIARLSRLIKQKKFWVIITFPLIEWVTIGVFIELLSLVMKVSNSVSKSIFGKVIFETLYNYRQNVADLYLPLFMSALETLFLIFLICYTFGICLDLSAFFDFRPIPLLHIVKKISCVLDGSCSLTKTEKKVLVFTVLGWVWVFISHDSIYRDYRITWRAFLEGLEVWKSILTFLLGR